ESMKGDNCMKLRRFEVLSDTEIKRVNDAALHILENTGMKIMSENARRILADGGCDVDESTKICRFPQAVVEECLKKVPHQFDLYDRNGNKALTIGDGTVHCAAGHNAVFCIDSDNPERRYSTVKDVEEFGIISQWCDSIDLVGTPLNPFDVNPESTLLHAAKALFKTTTKPLVFSTESAKIVEALIDMMKAVGGENIASKPNAIIQLSPSSPLFWGGNTVDGVLAVAKAGLPLIILPEPMSGVSAPYSVAGLLTENTAEMLSGVVIAELVNPGTPVMYGASWTTYDMKYSAAKIGAPESALLTIAGCQMAGFYGLPSHTTATNSDGNAHDEHQAWESVTNNILAMNSGNDIVMNSGMFACGLTTSLEQLVMDNEINRINKRLMTGIDASDDMVARDVIEEVGPMGSFLMEEHTLDNLYSGEFWEPTIKITQSYEKWKAEGCQTVDKVAGKLVREILEKGNTSELDPEKYKALDDIIERFEKSI
ncbi:MAG: trimethylamine methyltransferase family protein, partial [Lachnospiraceae bacterium]|nr:trimethylamine methyltransferase family protein [Lachnospiraceae bacterium]